MSNRVTSFLISIPLLFIVIVGFVVSKVSTKQNEIESLVSGISDIKILQECITKKAHTNSIDKTQKNTCIEILVSLNEDESIQNKDLPQKIEAILITQNVNSKQALSLNEELDDEIKFRRAGLSIISQELSSFWFYSNLISLFSCLLASIVATLLYLNIRRKKDLEKLKLSIENSNVALTELHKYKDDYLAILTHEIRTPISALIASNNLLLTEVAIKNKDLVKLQLDSAQNLLKIVDDILDFESLKNGLIQPNLSKGNLFDISTHVINLYKSKATSIGTALNLEYDDKIPNELLIDSDRIRQVLINLIDNAVKFTSNGEITLIVKLINIEKNLFNIHFEITDTGEGIDPIIGRDIFDRYTQASNEMYQKHGGSGLGLSIVKMLVEMMGSKINFKSEKGKGASFYFNLAFKNN